MNNLVLKLETCLKLGEAGYPDNTNFVWRSAYVKSNPPLLDHRGKTHPALILAPAPTLGELLVEVKDQIKKQLDSDTDSLSFPDLQLMKKFEHELIDSIMQKEPEEAVARMWLRKEK